MKENLKPTWRLILERIRKEEIWVIVLFLVAILIILAYNLLSEITVIGCLKVIVSFITNGKDLFYSLAISYVSGVIVYFLTVVLYETRKSKFILVDIEKTLKDLKYEFGSIANFDNPNDAVQNIIETVNLYGRFNEKYYSLYFMDKALEKVFYEMEKLTLNVLSFSSALQAQEIDILVDIRSRQITKKIKNKYGVENLIDVHELYTYFEDMVKLYADINKLHGSIRNRIYKQIEND